jgi:hypothetical protein
MTAHAHDPVRIGGTRRAPAPGEVPEYKCRSCGAILGQLTAASAADAEQLREALALEQHLETKRKEGPAC